MAQRIKNAEKIDLLDSIRNEKKRRKWNLAVLADHLGISKDYMTAISRGARTIIGLNRDAQRKLASFLGISLIDLLLECGDLKPTDFQIQHSQD